MWPVRSTGSSLSIRTCTCESQGEALDAVLSAETIDPAAVTALAGKVDIACQACHAVYREQDPVTNEYRLKPGSVQ